MLLRQHMPLVQKLCLLIGFIPQVPAISNFSQTAFLANAVQAKGELGIEDELGISTHDIERNVVQIADLPRIYQVDGFLTESECRFLREHGGAHLQESLTIDASSGNYRPDPVRTSMQMYVSEEDCRQHPVISRIVRRMYRFARIPLGHGEQIQIGRYKVGQMYKCHYDSEVRVDVVRPATLLVYISDVGAGGDTVFPFGHDCSNLGDCCHGNATLPLRRIKPKMGRAVLFYTHDVDGTQNVDALHGSCPVDDGEKWIVQAWFRSKLYFASPHYHFGKLQHATAEVSSEQHEL